MAAAGLFMPSLGIWKPSPARIKHSPRLHKDSIKRRSRNRTTPPIISDDVAKRLEAERDLEILQERHIRNKIRTYLKPFRIFLGFIGRFPYTEIETKKKRSVIHAIKRTSCAPIMELGGLQTQMERENLDNEGPIYTYDPKSPRGVIFILTTLLSLIIMIVACTGYIDLCLTEHKYRDMIEKEINGELTCNGFNKSVKDENYIRRTRQALFSPTANGFFEEMIFTWNCSHATKILRTCYDSKNSNPDPELDHESRAIEFLNLPNCPDFNVLITDEDDSERIHACELAVKLKKSVDNSMIFLIVIFACLLNTILQSWIPIFHGKFKIDVESGIDVILFVAFLGKKSAKFLTHWTRNLAKTRFDVSDGIRRRVITELIFLAIFQAVFITLYFVPEKAFSSSGVHFVKVR